MSSGTAVPTAREIVEADSLSFDRLADRVLEFQRAQSPVYGRYCASEGVREGYAGLTPYLPISAFKHGPVYTGKAENAERVFKSSGTAGTSRSSHHVRDLSYYDLSLETSFVRCFGQGPFRILAHLPQYAEESSLVYMLRRLMDTFGAPDSTFFLDDVETLKATIHTAGPPLVLFGAAFGLLNLVERETYRLPPTALVIETGGMKTHRRSVSREALHESLIRGFGLARNQLWSEYGMCELLSQCYAPSGEAFSPPPWMRCHVVDPERPWVRRERGQSGALAVLDLANVHSASAILTEDRAVAQGQGFEILGRLTGAELRGCNHLLEST